MQILPTRRSVRIVYRQFDQPVELKLDIRQSNYGLTHWILFDPS